MANNRLFLVHRPTGESVYLGKRMGYGWYGAYSDLGSRLNEFFSRCAEKGYAAALQKPWLGAADDQDDFVLAIEDASGSPNATDEWDYDKDNNPRLRQ